MGELYVPGICHIFIRYGGWRLYITALGVGCLALLILGKGQCEGLSTGMGEM